MRNVRHLVEWAARIHNSIENFVDKWCLTRAINDSVKRPQKGLGGLAKRQFPRRNPNMCPQMGKGKRNRSPELTDRRWRNRVYDVLPKMSPMISCGKRRKVDKTDPRSRINWSAGSGSKTWRTDTSSIAS